VKIFYLLFLVFFLAPYSIGAHQVEDAACAAKLHRLGMVKQTCTQMVDWKDEAKCYRGGLGLAFNASPADAQFVLAMCSAGVIKRGSVKCFNQAIRMSQNEALSVVLLICNKEETWEDRDACFKTELEEIMSEN